MAPETSHSHLPVRLPALQLLNIRKTFGALVALDDVSITVADGTVHGLLGENGAGKSTLMNIAYGMLRADAGGGFVSPRQAIAAGIGMVHQHFALAPAMTVLDNVLLGDPRVGRIVPRKELAQKLSQMAAKLNLPLDPLARVETLSVGQQQRVEILKALWRDARVLILDEPTAVLTPPEAEQLFGAVEQLRAQGRAVVFISHKLAEIVRLCDHLTVLRRGRVVFDAPAKGVSSEEIAAQMVGQMPESPRMQASAPSPNASEPVLVIDNASAGILRNVSLELPPGSITGIAGVDGNGQQELADLIVGLRPSASGLIFLETQDITSLTAAGRAQRGIAHIPNDRKREALAPTLSITENLITKLIGQPPLSTQGVISWNRARAAARAMIRQFDIRAASERTTVGTLSGGNQQKVVLARELALALHLGLPAPKLIVAMNPARGLDLVATRFVYDQLAAARARGAAILLISSELDELLALSDRVAVLYSGQLTLTDFPRTPREEIGNLMAGIASAM